MKHLLILTGSVLLLAVAGFWLLGGRVGNRQIQSPNGPGATDTVTRSPIVKTSVRGTIVEPAQVSAGLAFDGQTNQGTNSIVAIRPRDNRPQFLESPFQTEVVPLDEILSVSLNQVMRGWKIARQFEVKPTAPTSLIEAEAFLYKSVNMALGGGPAKCVEYQGVFFFSGGTSTHRVTDFSTGYAIPKGTVTIYTWDREANAP